MSMLDGVKDRIVVFRDAHGDLVARVLAGCMIGAVLGGAYVTGKRVERQWWRSEIAAKSAAVKTIMGRLAADAPGYDERLIAEWSREHAETLRAAERALEEARTAARSAPPDDPCRPVPAHCLLGGSRGGPAAGPAAGR